MPEIPIVGALPNLGIAKAAKPALILSVAIRVLIVDDHQVVRAGLKALIAEVPDFFVVADGGNGEQGVALHALHKPDVTLMDLRMPILDGIGAIRAIISKNPSARIVALTTYDGDADIFRALNAGACAYLIKDMMGAEIVHAIRSAAAGKRVIPDVVAQRLAEFIPRVDLSPREIEVLSFAGKGLRNKEIARVIGRSEETIKVHLKHIMQKLSATDRTEAVTIAMQRGIIHLYD